MTSIAGPGGAAGVMGLLLYFSGFALGLVAVVVLRGRLRRAAAGMLVAQGAALAAVVLLAEHGLRAGRTESWWLLGLMLPVNLAASIVHVSLLASEGWRRGTKRGP